MKKEAYERTEPDIFRIQTEDIICTSSPQIAYEDDELPLRR